MLILLLMLMLMMQLMLMLMMILLMATTHVPAPMSPGLTNAIFTVVVIYLASAEWVI